MTRLGPLTSQALGRSPYDIVVPGDGPADPRVPAQAFDERGRPVNAETKRINRAIVRSHNEVMHVIGVAEPDSALLSDEPDVDRQLMQQHYEDEAGQRLWGPACMLSLVGIWGADPLRQRALVYRRFSDHLPWVHFRQDYGPRALADVLTAGLPVYMLDKWLWLASLRREDVRNSFWKRAVVQHLRLHLQIFLCLRRLAIIPASVWMPGLLFFVPFSSQSPISRPGPFPALSFSSSTIAAVAQWVGRAALQVVPVLAFYGYTELWNRVVHRLNRAIFAQLDVPQNPPLVRPETDIDPVTGEWRLAGLPPIEVYPPRSSALPPLQPVQTPQPLPPPLSPAAASQQPQQQPPPPPPPPAPQEQQPEIPPTPADGDRPVSGPSTPGSTSTFALASAAAAGADEAANQRERGAASDRGDGSGGVDTAAAAAATDDDNDDEDEDDDDDDENGDGGDDGDDGDDGYVSEEEEFELSATLISFDVEAPEAGDAPPNAWSAELRQSTSVHDMDGFDGERAGDAGGGDGGGGGGGAGRGEGGPGGGGGGGGDGSGSSSGDHNGEHRSGFRAARGTYIRGVYYPGSNQRFFADNMLTRLPAAVHAAGAAHVATSVVLLPFEASVVRQLARAYRLGRGLAADDLLSGPLVALGGGGGGAGGLTLAAANHVALVVLLQLAVHTGGVLVALGLGWLYRGSEQGWSFARVVREKLAAWRRARREAREAREARAARAAQELREARAAQAVREAWDLREA